MSITLPADLKLYCVVRGNHKRWKPLQFSDETRLYHTSLLSAVNMACEHDHILECRVDHDFQVRNVMADNQWIVQDPKDPRGTMFEPGLTQDFVITFHYRTLFESKDFYIQVHDDDLRLGTLYLQRKDWDKVRYNRVFYYVDCMAFKRQVLKHRCVLEHDPYQFEKMTDYEREGIVRKVRA